MVRDTCRKSMEGHEVVPRFCHPSREWKTHSVNPAVNGYLFLNQGIWKEKAAKGEGWAPPFISCAQDTVAL